MEKCWVKLAWGAFFLGVVMTTIGAFVSLGFIDYPSWSAVTLVLAVIVGSTTYFAHTSDGWQAVTFRMVSAAFSGVVLWIVHHADPLRQEGVVWLVLTNVLETYWGVALITHIGLFVWRDLPFIWRERAGVLL